MRPDEESYVMDKEATGGSETEDKEVEVESPQTPTTPRKAFLFKGSPKNPTSPASSPLSDKRRSQDGSSESSPSSRKWSSPKNFFSALTPKKLKKTRSQAD
jgi:hypothetical protein